MAVEPHDGSSLPDVLVENNPLSDDPVAQGDDHLRLLKIVVKNFYTQYLAAGTSFDNRLGALELFAAAGDAATLGGQNALFFQNADNIAFGTLPAARLSGTYGINITGNAATATNATNAANAANATYATSAGNAATLGGQTLAQLQAQLPAAIDYATLSTITVGTGTTTVVDAPVTVGATSKWAIGEVQCLLDVSRTTPGGGIGGGANVSMNHGFVAEVRTIPSNYLIGAFVVKGTQMSGQDIERMNTNFPAGDGLVLLANGDPAIRSKLNYRGNDNPSSAGLLGGLEVGSNTLFRIPFSGVAAPDTTHIRLTMRSYAGGITAKTPSVKGRLI